MINNFDIIVPLLVFPNPGDSFYFVQLIQRRKDNPDISSNSRTIHSWYVESLEYLQNWFPDMMKMADIFNARLSICLNPLSYEITAFKTLQKIAHQMENRDFRSVKDSYNSVCGNYQGLMEKRWLVD